MNNPMSVWVSQVMGHPVDVPFPTSTEDLLHDRGRNRFLHLNVDLPESVDLHVGVQVGGATAEIYAPRGATGLPVVLFNHGGAWFKGSAEDERKLGMQIAEKGLVVVNLDYALAPEHPFPAGLDDVVQAAHWIAANVARYGGEPGRLALAGASAGANLAAAAAGVLCSEPGHPQVSALVLLYGIYDLGPIAAFPGPNPVFEAYLGDDWRDKVADPRVSPLQAALKDFPPTYLSCGAQDQALGLTLAMTGALASAGAEVTASVVAGADHVFLNIPGVIPGAAPELDRITAWLLAH
ncbi:alpha/beta hydrolase [Herbidospora mongoliensis]|uniref:alpha/beta hydrolase n=1 Tax=Herbidospora mongoliensis TaxID=688067 RepID=UPI000829A184|nr:alpha/beta hydrolase fold domain-containing protein [Herbidospora mongoliensis]